MKLPFYCVCMLAGLILPAKSTLQAVENEAQLQIVLHDAEVQSEALAQVCLDIVDEEAIYEEKVQEGGKIYNELKKDVDILKEAASSHAEWKEEIDGTLSHCAEMLEPVLEESSQGEDAVVGEILKGIDPNFCGACCQDCVGKDQSCCADCDCGEYESLPSRIYRSIVSTLGLYDEDDE